MVRKKELSARLDASTPLLDDANGVHVMQISTCNL